MNNIILDVDGIKCFAEVFYHRNLEFKLKLPRKKLQQLCVNKSKKIKVNFWFNMNWSELILAHLVTELKLVGFNHIKLSCPYLPFGRADKPESEDGCRRDILTTFFKMLKKIGINEVVTYDFHLGNLGDSFCGIKLENIKFADALRDQILHISYHYNNDKFLVFAPDVGASDRAWQTWSLLSEKLPNNPLYCKTMVFNKKRTKNGLYFDGDDEKYASNPYYQNRVCIIVDDMIDSGKTMLAAIEKVHKFKPKKIFVLVTHLLNAEFVAPDDVELDYLFMQDK